MRGVYLLHFSEPFGHAKHYTGYADDIARRCREHAAGRGANLMAHVVEAGITPYLARVWPDADRNRERQLKKQGGASRRCPVCKDQLLSDNGYCTYCWEPFHLASDCPNAPIEEGASRA